MTTLFISWRTDGAGSGLPQTGGCFRVAEKDFEEVAEGRQARVRSVVYGQDEGVPVSQAYKGYWPGALRSADGRLWIPLTSGLLVVDPSRLTENREPPPVVIERVVVDGQPVAVYECGQEPRAPGSAAPLDLRQPKAHLRLPPGPRQVELEYTGLSFVSPRNVTFKYRLARPGPRLGGGRPTADRLLQPPAAGGLPLRGDGLQQ